MADFDWKAVVKTVAPWIGTALGGPLGGLAVDAIGSAFGLSDKTESALKTAIQGATPEQILALKQAEQNFTAHMQEMGFKNVEALETLAVADRDSARKMQMATNSVMPPLLTWAITASFVTALVLLFVKDVPLANRDIIVYMVGQLSGFTAAVIAFWFGTTRDSARKTELLAQTDAVKS